MTMLNKTMPKEQTVLICESDIILRQIMRGILEQQDISIVEAGSRQQAIGQYYKHLPDVVILSEQLVDGNSFEVSKHISRVTTSNTSVMIISSRKDAECASNAFENGADDFMSKPLDMSVLVHRISHLLQAKQVVRQNEEQLNYLSNFDLLTGLPNRQQISERMEESLTKTSKNNNRAAMLLIDIDNFKRINDIFGHQVGDKILREISLRLGSNVRSTDVLMRDAKTHYSKPELARLGGDEFSIFVDDIDSVETAIAIAKRNVESVSFPILINNQEIVVTPSIGIAIFPDDGQDVNSLFKKAERAMYFVKSSGGGAYKLYNEKINKSSKKSFQLESDLRYALRENQLDLHYQPQVDSHTGKVICLEALARWDHPQLGMIPPDVFIPVAEETGLIITLGDWVLDKACRQAKSWLDQGLSFNRLSVNVSAHQFHRDDFFQKVVDTLNACELDPKHLELELTESILMSDVDESIEKLKLLKTFGVSLAIDDFGTGYSSLSYLKSFPIDTLKIDRSFIANIMKESADRAIVSAIIVMAEKLNLKVVAEGVEDLEQSNFLEENQCTLLQGFYFSKPKPAFDITQLIGKCINHNITTEINNEQYLQA